MRTQWVYLVLLLLLLQACSSGITTDVVTPGQVETPQVQESSRNAGYVSWGTYDMVIARDGSEWEIVPNRDADGSWGMHLNAVKLLEVLPGHDCIKIPKIVLLDNGDLAIDISITHPYNNAVYTGFDVRGIIMFPASQYIRCPEMHEKAGLPPPSNWHYRFASYRKGDAELIDPDGYTSIWSPYNIHDQKLRFELEEGFPIFEYFEGKMASGEDLGSINGFKRYYSNETRHMFEVGHTEARTYIVRPPETGPIQASYAIYAHWAVPDNIPVMNPATDFGPEANSPLPYDFYVEQVGIYDPDAPAAVNAASVLFHIKSWNFGIDNLWMNHTDLFGCGFGVYEILEAFDECPDCYRTGDLSTDYYKVPDELPGKWPVLFHLFIDNDGNCLAPHLATDDYILWMDIEAYDGQW